MNKVIRFYLNMLALLTAGRNPSQELKEKVIGVIVEGCSCQTDKIFIDELIVCVNDPDSAETFLEWYRFITTAFRDLSTMKNPLAMQVFFKCHSLYHKGQNNDGGIGLVVLLKRVKRRVDGSAVINVHVSNLKAFSDVIERNTLSPFTDGGVWSGW
jgi:hypothetical protein